MCFIAGAIIGGSLGMIIMCILAISKNDDM